MPCLILLGVLFAAFMIVEGVKSSSGRAAVRRAAQPIIETVDRALDDSVRSYESSIRDTYPGINWKAPATTSLRSSLGFSDFQQRTASESTERQIAASTPESLLRRALMLVAAEFASAFIDSEAEPACNGERNESRVCVRCGFEGEIGARTGLCRDCFLVLPANVDLRGATEYAISSTGMVHSPDCPSARRSPRLVTTLSSLKQGGRRMCQRCHPENRDRAAIKGWRPEAVRWAEREIAGHLRWDESVQPVPSGVVTKSQNESISWGWVVLVAVAILFAGSYIVSAVSTGEQPPSDTAATGSRTGGSPGGDYDYVDEDQDGHTHTNEPGHIHTQTEWVEGYYRSDGTYVNGHYRKVE